MHAFLQALEGMVAALAIAAFAHFGVTLKDYPREQQAVQRTPTLAASRGPAISRSTPCPLDRTSQNT